MSQQPFGLSPQQRSNQIGWVSKKRLFVPHFVTDGIEAILKMRLIDRMLLLRYPWNAHSWSSQNTLLNVVSNYLQDTKMNEMHSLTSIFQIFPIPNNKNHGANMGPTWVLSAPDGPNVGPMNLAIRDITMIYTCHLKVKEYIHEICNSAWIICLSGPSGSTTSIPHKRWYVRIHVE